MPELLVPDYTASERQTKFHLSTAYETLYGGAAGGGKSAALCAEAVTLALEYPGIRIYMFRNSVPELKITLIPEIQKQCAAYMNYGYMSWHGQDRQFRFSNGSQIQMAYMENPGDQYNYQGAEIHVLMFDELTHFTFDQYEYLKTRVRDGSGKYPLKIMAATNPGNVGHGWVKNYFIDATRPEVMFTDTNGMTRIFIPAKVDDHPDEAFRIQYTRSLDSITNEAMRRALREGDWDQFSGQVFTEWRREKHVVTPFTIPDHWRKWFGYDYGYGSWAAGLWFARDPANDRTYIYREFYETQMNVTDQAEKIKLLDSGEQIVVRLADPSIWKAPGNANSGENIAQLFDKAGLAFTPANNDRLAGKQAWHENLSIGSDGEPRLQVFSNCLNLIRTLPTLPYDQHKVEDVDTKAEDHLYDAGRYGLVNTVHKPKEVKKVRRRFDPNTGRLLS